jgi:putative transposase
MRLQFFDPEADFGLTRRNLPHWQQPGAIYFITFRTFDSLPKEVVQRWIQERDAWLISQGIDASRQDWQLQMHRLAPATRARVRRRLTEDFDRYLDQCHGACALRASTLAGIVASSLRHFDGQRYDLGDFVVMPNHVHLLVQFLGDTTPTAQCKSWKRYTATSINRCLGRQGHFWQDESFDHLVRSEDEFNYLREYIESNPVRARLPVGDYLYQRDNQ